LKNLFIVYSVSILIKEETIMKKTNLNAKLAGASAMLLLSASMLGTSTYAWFTMNKEVSVTGMEVKAHAEEGLLINEVKAANSQTWDDAATAGTNTVALRPASTSDLTTWWHANSKQYHEEAGIGELENTVQDANGNYYANVSASNTPTISDQTLVYDEGQTTQTDYATGNTKAETHVYYKDASFGTDSQYDPGEGFYVKYIYYLKSSGEEDLEVTDLQARVKAYAKAGDTGNTADLMKSLRVGIEVPASNANNAARAGFGIFAPVPGADDSYGVTADAVGTAGSVVTVNPVDATTLGTATAFTTLNISSGDPATPATITIPDYKDTGIPVYVYVWFEGEDNACTSENLQTIISTYDIDIDFSVGNNVY
jgi:hypothetical protein